MALHSSGVDWGLCRLIDSLLRHRTVEAEWAGVKRSMLVGCGCPQDGVLSPLLWNILVGGLLSGLTDNTSYIQAYADDIVMVFRGSDVAELHASASEVLRLAHVWALNNDLSFSAEKSQVVVFTWRRRWVLPPILLDGNVIPRVAQVKYLGITLDQKLSWRAHITDRVGLTLGLLGQIGRTMGRSWGLSPKLIMWAYKALVLPFLEYACLVWAGAVSKFYIETALSKVQRLACCMMLSAFPSTATCVLGTLLALPPLPDYIFGRAVEAKHRLTVWGRWRGLDDWAGPGGRRSLSSHVRTLQRAGSILPEVDMPSDIIKPLKSPPPSCTFVVEDRETAIAAAMDPEPAAFNCFTDGSRQGERSGCGYVVYDPGGERFNSTVPLGQYATVFQAEIHAIASLACELGGRGVSNSSINIFSDSQAAIFFS